MAHLPMKRLLLSMALGVSVLAVVLVARTLTFKSRQVVPEEATALTVDAQALASRLSGALRLKTVAASEGVPADAEAFAALHAYLAEHFPRVHAELKREVVGAHSLLYTWQGTDASLRPMMLLGHLDVVPVTPGTEGAWAHPPFDGVVADGFVWGRGSLDDKGSVLAQLEAVEALLAAGEKPRRTVLLAFGADEEVGGREGAVVIAKRLQERGVRLESVLDEGGVIMSGTVPGVSAPVALVGTSEKGFVSVVLSVKGEGGHSSMPPPSTAVGVLARAVSRLEAAPMPTRLQGGSRELFTRVGPEMPFGMRLLFANLWLTEPLVVRRLTASPTTNAAVRTTTAVTVFEGGVKDNVLPASARAVVNFRILPGDSVEGVLSHVRATVDDSRVEVGTLDFQSEPSPVSPTDSESWRELERSLRQVFPDVLVSPYLNVAATDSRHFVGLSDNVYRFFPAHLRREDLARIHGKDERIAVTAYADAVRFYAQYLRNAAR
ncbi:M20 family peptidase [Myxococcus llanfairpwllgwyngyllgogerychwyrndrobwllllantysiliogogogochensis]|uniref:M20 family peptidase n=1 Tax=Myxococcus llanfairpwllgwyngyllgogerychwyrndrobwllllantysiliogogogochensis TaxID=2590453 RepID=UPI00248281EF|nr:M20 family peptidase [Myxococcus llanfairpwllgwyngyllgogerychwyrndrobwllllantysiliogogogochensis]